MGTLSVVASPSGDFLFLAFGVFLIYGKGLLNAHLHLIFRIGNWLGDQTNLCMG